MSSDTTSILIRSSPSRQLDIDLVHGSILDIDAPAIAVGIYEGMFPNGAARMVDRVIGKEIENIYRLRMFSGRIGEIYFLPCHRRSISTEFVILVGLGSIDDVLKTDVEGNRHSRQEQTLRKIGSNLVRAMVSAKISHLGTVLMGASTGLPADRILASLLEGVTQATVNEDQEELVRKLTICEIDDTRYSKIQKNMRHLLSESVPDELEIRLTPRFIEATRSWEAETNPQLQYLYTSGEEIQGEGGFRIKLAFMGQSMGAAVFETTKFVADANISNTVKALPNGNNKEVKAAGKKITELVLTSQITTTLNSQENTPIVIVSDAITSTIPWELLIVDKYIPALTNGISRLLRTSPNTGFSGVPILSEKEKLHILIISDPTGDLSGARTECEVLKAVLERHSKQFTFYELGNAKNDSKIEEATRENIIKHFNSGEYDVVHYAGHAFFNVDNRSLSGLNTSDNKVVSGIDLRGVEKLPEIMIFNACESGRVRKSRDGTTIIQSGDELNADEKIKRNISFAEAIISSGISHFIGTYWEVGDDAAKQFSEKFYADILKGKTIGDAIKSGRLAIHEIQGKDWANYIHYGDPNYRIVAV